MARPKSSTLTLPSGQSMRLVGLRSRWQIDSACAADSTAHAWAAMAAAQGTGSGPCSLTTSATVTPSMNCIT